MVGSGNDFIIFDNRELNIKNLSELAKKYCQRVFGIGADGLIAVEKSKRADFKMRIINPDGSEAEMCGNGSRCVSFFAHENKIAKEKMVFETLAGLISAEVKKNIIKVGLTKPSGFYSDFIKYKGKAYKIYFINTGVPHTILFFNEIEKLDVNNFGKFVRYHKKFSPKGTNVDFVKIIKGNSIYVRTYERGVESETLACGTGSTAAALISGLVKGLSAPIVVNTKGGEKLKINFKIFRDEIEKVYLEGIVKKVFIGEININ